MLGASDLFHRSRLKRGIQTIIAGVVPRMHKPETKPGSLLALMLVALSFCGANAQDRSPATLARTVTIYRDTYGVPHVFGRTDASTVFGFAYAQAEDNF